MAKYLAPSKILFTTTMDEKDIKQTVNTVFKNIMTRCGEFPVIQVVERNGLYFAINNSKLETCRMLEKQGKCSKVRLDVIPWQILPTQVQKIVFEQSATSSQDEKHGTSSTVGEEELVALCHDETMCEREDGGRDTPESLWSSSDSESDIFDWASESPERQPVNCEDDYNDDDELGQLLS